MDELGSESSNIKQIDAVISNKASFVCGFDLLTDGTNNATLILYDSASAASGKVLLRAALAGGNTSLHHDLAHPISAANGIYADVETANEANYVVRFRNKP